MGLWEHYIGSESLSSLPLPAMATFEVVVYFSGSDSTVNIM